MSVIQLRNVQKTYPGGQPGLKSFDLMVNPGEFLFVAGASGAGKSTFLKLLYGEEQASSGEVKVVGQQIKALNNRELAKLRRALGIVFQDYRLMARRSVADNVGLPLEIQGIKSRERRHLVTQMLKAVGLGDKGDQEPNSLSGGEQQRIAVARALINRPKVLIADEPTGNLDDQMARVIFNLFCEANKLGVTVIIATHNLSMVEEFGYRTVVLDQGLIVGDFPSSN